MRIADGRLALRLIRPGHIYREMSGRGREAEVLGVRRRYLLAGPWSERLAGVGARVFFLAAGRKDKRVPRSGLLVERPDYARCVDRTLAGTTSHYCTLRAVVVTGEELVEVMGDGRKFKDVGELREEVFERFLALWRPSDRRGGRRVGTDRIGRGGA